VAISTSRLAVFTFLFRLVSHAAPLFAQQSGQTPVPATVSTTDLRPGTWCRVTLRRRISQMRVLSWDMRGRFRRSPKTRSSSSPLAISGMKREFHSWQHFRTSASTSTVRPSDVTWLPAVSPLAKIAAIECRGGTNEDRDTDSLERIGVDFK